MDENCVKKRFENPEMISNYRDLKCHSVLVFEIAVWTTQLNHANNILSIKQELSQLLTMICFFHLLWQSFLSSRQLKYFFLPAFAKALYISGERRAFCKLFSTSFRVRSMSPLVYYPSVRVKLTVNVTVSGHVYCIIINNQKYDIMHFALNSCVKLCNYHYVKI